MRAHRERAPSRHGRSNPAGPAHDGLARSPTRLPLPARERLRDQASACFPAVYLGGVWPRLKAITRPCYRFALRPIPRLGPIYRTAADETVARGTLNQNRVVSGSASTPTCPPPSSTSVFTMARPMPAPPLARSRDLSTR